MSGITAGTHTEEVVTVAGFDVQLRRGGAGKPLIFLHGELGLPGWTAPLEQLSERYEVFAPSMPGFGASQRPDWIMHVDDMATWLVSFIETVGIEGRPAIVASSLGAWVTVHLAAVNRDLFDKIVLINPCGVKPREGEIWDYYFWPTKDGFDRAFSDTSSPEYVRWYGEWTLEDGEQAEVDREMQTRLTWKPYMFGLTTETRARQIRTPTLILVASGEQIVPNDCGRILHEAIAGSQFTIIDGGGHLVELEKPTETTAAVTAFLG
jgi:pimeloyl-ACP methyl ester carboxylesterase